MNCCKLALADGVEEMEKEKEKKEEEEEKEWRMPMMKESSSW